jgi:hypothetical protein
VIRAIILAAVFFAACDGTSELAARVHAEFDGPAPTAQAVDCARGQTRWLAPQIAMAIDCEKFERVRR